MDEFDLKLLYFSIYWKKLQKIEDQFMMQISVSDERHKKEKQKRIKRCCGDIPKKYIYCFDCKDVLNRHIKKICSNKNQLKNIKCNCNYCNFFGNPYSVCGCGGEIYYCEICIKNKNLIII